jgi:uroporphyrinogen-III synthase
MSEPKIHILSTATLSESIRDQALDQGVAVDQLPFIETHSVVDSQLSSRILVLSSQSRAVAFTSAHALDAVGACLQGTCPPWRIYALDGETRKKAVELFGPEAIAQTASNSLSLANKMLQDHLVEVVFFCGTIRRDELPDLLAQHQVHVVELAVYQTTLLHHDVTQLYDGILFFSPSGVESFFSTNQLNPDTVLFALGPTTAEAVKKYSGNQLVTSSKPDKGLLVSQSINHLLHNRLPSGSSNTRTT